MRYRDFLLTVATLLFGILVIQQWSGRYSVEPVDEWTAWLVNERTGELKKCSSRDATVACYGAAVEKTTEEQVSRAVIEPTLAIYPFVPMSEDKELGWEMYGYVSDSLSERTNLEIRTRREVLESISEHHDLLLIAQDLGVSCVLEGSISEHDDKIRFTAQVVQVDDESHLWFNTYEVADADELPELANRIATKVGQVTGTYR